MQKSSPKQANVEEIYKRKPCIVKLVLMQKFKERIRRKKKITKRADSYMHSLMVLLFS